MIRVRIVGDEKIGCRPCGLNLLETEDGKYVLGYCTGEPNEVYEFDMATEDVLSQFEEAIKHNPEICDAVLLRPAMEAVADEDGNNIQADYLHAIGYKIIGDVQMRRQLGQQRGTE